MAKEVSYIMSLKDMLTPGLKKAEEHAGKLENALHRASHTGLHMMEGMGVAFAAFKGFDFLEKSMHSFHELHEQEALLENTLASVGERAHMSGEDMLSFAQRLHHAIPQNTGDILGMESAMARFNITNKDTFERLIKLSADVSIATKRSGTEAATALGMVFENPMLGMRRLMQMDIKFTQQQQGVIAHLIATGKLAQAQELIFSSLGKRGYEGAAAAAAAADPLKKFHDLIYDIQISVGKWGTALLHRLTPALEWVIQAIKNSLSWIREHKDLLLSIGVVVGIVGGAYLIYTTYSASAAIATKLLTAAQWLLNSALLANPVMIVVEAIALMVGAVIYAWNKWAGFRAFLMAMWGVIKEFGRIVTDVFVGLWHTIHGVFTFSPSEIKSGWSQMTSAMGEAGTRMAHAYKEGWDSGMADFAKDHQESASKMNLITPATKKTKGLSSFDSMATQGKPISKGTGQKNIHIDIKIGALISGGFQVHTTNIKESYEKVRDHVTSVLMSAINDSQIVSEK